MKNRDRYINKVNEYDMLISIQTALDDGEGCVLDALTKTTNICFYNTDKQKDCETCIQQWLNEEE